MSPNSRHTLVFCPSCKQYLPPDEFWRNRSRPNGLAGWCKTCYRTNRTIRNDMEVVLIEHYRAKRSAFSVRKRAQWDREERRGAQVFVDVHGTIYRWNRYRVPAFQTLDDFLVEMTNQQKQIRYA